MAEWDLVWKGLFCLCALSCACEYCPEMNDGVYYCARFGDLCLKLLGTTPKNIIVFDCTVNRARGVTWKGVDILKLKATIRDRSGRKCGKHFIFFCVHTLIL